MRHGYPASPSHSAPKKGRRPNHKTKLIDFAFCDVCHCLTELDYAKISGDYVNLFGRDNHGTQGIKNTCTAQQQLKHLYRLFALAVRTSLLSTVVAGGTPTD
jgi:hypothetical protein